VKIAYDVDVCRLKQLKYIQIQKYYSFAEFAQNGKFFYIRGRVNYIKIISPPMELGHQFFHQGIVEALQIMEIYSLI